MARSAGMRAGFLFLDFLLIILAYYQVKPASRSLFLEHLSPEMLPWVWIGSACTLGVMMPFYQRLVQRHSRHRIVLGSCALFIGILITFRLLLSDAGAVTAFCFYIFVDIMSVVLVEQLWSMSNSSFDSRDGKRWYGVVSSGGLVGGVAGSLMANWLLTNTSLQTADLLLTAAALIGLILLLSFALLRIGLLAERQLPPATAPLFRDSIGNWRLLISNRYLGLIAACLLFAQLLSPIAEYQFMTLVAVEFTEVEERTAFLSLFLSALSALALAINIFATPLILKFFGAIGGLLMQPVAMIVSAASFALQPGLNTAIALRMSDKSLGYSITRASRELLYVPIDSVTIYRAKAWIDMFGYRLFKIIGALLIQLFTVWLPWQLGVAGLSWLVIGGCCAWVACALALRQQYQELGAIEEQALAAGRGNA